MIQLLRRPSESSNVSELSLSGVMPSLVKEGDLLWAPSESRLERSQLTHYMQWLKDRGWEFHSYRELWQWSVTSQDEFWGSVWDFNHIRASVGYERVLGTRILPGAQWFPGARLNYAEHALRFERKGADALIFATEDRLPQPLSWTALGDQVRKLAMHLRGLGVTPGDRVIAYLTNCPEAVIAMLATASVGAIWASCGPDLGPQGTIDRFAQLRPTVAFCVDGYLYGGKRFDRREALHEILKSLPSLRQVIYLKRLDPHSNDALTDHAISWEEAVAGVEVPAESFRFEQVPFSHPLWILFSSGTTGLPKPIVHSHGGMVLEQLKSLKFHMDLHPQERFFIFTTTGWMMWNVLVSALLVDAVPVLYDGNPNHPQPDTLWSLVERTGASFFGTSPSYIAMLEKAGVVPRTRFDLSRLQSMLVAGSPVTASCMTWLYKNVKADLWAHSGSGGTDLCTGIVGGIVTQPVYAGEIQGPQLGVAVYAYDEHGHELIDQVGEMVITRPLPSMPVGFWNDPDGNRYHDSYFNHYPNTWRHGDFFKLNGRGGCFVLGRSDATLNRYGIRIGTAEIYRALMELEEIEDALIVNLDLSDGGFFMPLFVQMRDGRALDDLVRSKIRLCMRDAYSARHVPDKIYAVSAIPYTLTGKKMEVPVRRLLMGATPDVTATRATMANSLALDWFMRYAQEQRDYRL